MQSLDNSIAILDAIDDGIDDGGTELHEAAEENDTKAARKLIYNGANINARDNKGETPLHWAVWEGNYAMVKLLVQNGANRYATDKEGDTPLDFAKEKNYRRIAQLLR